MILVFGGAYQGKLDYVKKNIKNGTVCDCSDGREPDFTADIICGIEGFVMDCVKAGTEAADWFRQREGQWLTGTGRSETGEKILVITDTSQGVVPIDKDVRAFREMNGRLMLYLAGNAGRVYRVFCGIGKEIKNQDGYRE